MSECSVESVGKSCLLRECASGLGEGVTGDTLRRTLAESSDMAARFILSSPEAACTAASRSFFPGGKIGSSFQPAFRSRNPNRILLLVGLAFSRKHVTSECENKVSWTSYMIHTFRKLGVALI